MKVFNKVFNFVMFLLWTAVLCCSGLCVFADIDIDPFILVPASSTCAISYLNKLR